MAERCYRGDGVTLRLRQRPGVVSLHIEHQDGAALIAPEVECAEENNTLIATVTGFDGTTYNISATPEQVRLSASQKTPVTAGQLELTVPRAAELEKQTGRVRRTGDEVTMPIGVREPLE